MVACPFDVPKFEYEQDGALREEVHVLRGAAGAGTDARRAPRSVPSGALQFGKRAELLEEARTRIYQNPDKYVHHIYGEHEAGGTSWLYISDVAVEQLGLKSGPEHDAVPRADQDGAVGRAGRA